MGADFSRILIWFVVNREAYGEVLRPFIDNKKNKCYEKMYCIILLNHTFKCSECL